MPFEAKFLNLSTDNYKCFLVNPSNYDVIDSIELDETAMRKMNCPFEKFIIIMKNLSNPKEELLFDLPQCELYTIDKDFSQIFTIIKSDKQGKRFEGIPAPKNFNFAVSGNIENSNKHNSQNNGIKEVKATYQIETKDNLKLNYSPNNSEIYPANNKPFIYSNSDFNNNNSNYSSTIHGNNCGIYKQIPAKNYSNNYYSRNYYTQNNNLANYPSEDQTDSYNNHKYNNADRSFNKEITSNQYNDIFGKDNIFISNSNSQNTSRSYIELTPEKYKITDYKSYMIGTNTNCTNINNDINFHKNSLNPLTQENTNNSISHLIAAQANILGAESNKHNGNQSHNYNNKVEPVKIAQSTEPYSELQKKSDANINQLLKSNENNSGFEYTIDNFDLNKFLKELNIPSSNLLIDSKENKNTNTNVASAFSAGSIDTNIKIAFEDPAVNFSLISQEKNENYNKPSELAESDNSQIIANETSKKEVLNEPKIKSNSDNSFNESKNNLARNLNESSYINENIYYNDLENYNFSKSILSNISANKICIPEENFFVYEDKRESNLTNNNNNSFFANDQNNQCCFDSKYYYLERENIKSNYAITPTKADYGENNNYSKDSIKPIIQEKNNEEDMKSETKVCLNQEQIELNNSRLIITSSANIIEEKKLPATLIDFNIDDYLNNILKEYGPSFINIPSKIPVEAEVNEIKPELIIKQIGEKPNMSNMFFKKQEEPTQVTNKEENENRTNFEVVKIQREVCSSIIKEGETTSSNKNYNEKLINIELDKHPEEKKENSNNNINKIEEEANNSNNVVFDIISNKDTKFISPSIEKQEQLYNNHNYNNNNSELNDKSNTMTPKKSLETSQQEKKVTKISELIKSEKIIIFPSIEEILSSSNLNFEEILIPKYDKNKNDDKTKNNLDENKVKYEVKTNDDIKLEKTNFCDILDKNFQTDSNIRNWTLKDISASKENSDQEENYFEKKKINIDYQIENNITNEDILNKEIKIGIIGEELEKQPKFNKSKSTDKDPLFEISFKEKSSEKIEEFQFTLDPNNSSKRNSFIIEEKGAKDSLKTPELQSLNSAKAAIIENEFNIDEHNKKEILVFYTNEIDAFYGSIRNLDKTIIGIVYRNNIFYANKDLFSRSKTQNKIALKNNSDKNLFVRLTMGKDEDQDLKPNANFSFKREEGKIYKLQISLEAEFTRGPVFNVFPGCNYSIDKNIQLYDSNGEQVLLSYSRYPNNDHVSIFNNVLFTFLEFEHLVNLNSLSNLTHKDFITFINATAEKVMIRIKSDGENCNEDYYSVFPLMTLLIQRRSNTELLSEMKTASQKIIKYNLTTDNIYILDEDHSLVKASNKEIIENLDQTIKFQCEEAKTKNLISFKDISTNNLNENQSKNNEMLVFKKEEKEEYEEEDYFEYEQTTEFDEENLNEFNIENISEEDLYLRIELKTEGKDAFYMLRSTENCWIIREDGYFLCEIVRKNLSSRRFVVSTSHCYEIDKNFNLIESVSKKLIRRSFDRLPGKKLIFEGVHAQINYDLDFDFDYEADYFEDVKPKYIKGNIFIDESFPPKNQILAAINPLDKKRADANNPHSLEKISDTLISGIVFQRPKVIFKGQKVFLFNVDNFHEENNENQAYSSISFISSILSTLKEDKRLLKRIFKSIQINKDGYYEIYFYEKNGKRKLMFLDDYFPVFSSAYSNSHACIDKAYFSEPSLKNEIWMQILEKAYAKYEGGYANITDGDVLSEIYFYTGAISYKYPTKGLTEEIIWENLIASSSAKNSNNNNGILVLAGFNDVESKNIRNRTVPLTQITYTVLACDEFDNGVETVRIIKMKYPTGHIEWLGEYSKGSEKWSNEMKIYFEEEKAFKENGVFFLSFEEFVNQFDFYVLSFSN